MHGGSKTGYQKTEVEQLIKFLLPHPQMGLAGNCRLGKVEAMKQRLSGLCGQAGMAWDGCSQNPHPLSPALLIQHYWPLAGPAGF